MIIHKTVGEQLYLVAVVGVAVARFCLLRLHRKMPSNEVEKVVFVGMVFENGLFARTSCVHMVVAIGCVLSDDVS